MIVQFNLPIKAFSINATSYRNKAFKTTEYRAWESEIAEFLDEIKDLTDLADKWRIRGGDFAVTLNFVYPKHVYFNKAGEISAKTFDLSNVEKPLIDQIFGTRMGVNDRFITSLKSYKLWGASWEIQVTLELRPKAA